LKSQAILLQGNQAIAEGAFYAGARFYAGYPITPSSEIAEECSKRMPQLGGVYMQMEDEIASVAAIIGASLAGAKSFTATSGPGFSLMQENMGLAVMGEVPCVIIDVQRSGPSTGLATKPAQSDLMQLRWGRHGDQIAIALCPATVKECFSVTVTAFNFAEKFRVPVVLAPDEVVAHMRENMVMPAPGDMEVMNRKRPATCAAAYRPFAADEDGIAPLAAYGDDCIFHITSSMHGPDGYSNNDPANAAWRVAQLHRKLQMHRDEIVITKAFDAEDADVLLIAFGITTRASRAAAAALRKEGVKAGVLQLITLWPFADKEVARYGSNAKTVVVTEMNYSGQMAGEVQKVLGSEADIRKVNKFNGQIITPQEILDSVHGPKA